MELQTCQNDLKSILATSWKRFGPMLANVRIRNNVSINTDIASERFFERFFVLALHLSVYVKHASHRRLHCSSFCSFILSPGVAASDTTLTHSS